MAKATRASAKPAARAAKKTAAKPAATAVLRRKPAAIEREVQEGARLVRDSFTMPEAEYAVLAQAKQACLKAGVEVKKSELLRIGVALLGRMDAAALKKALAGLPIIKTGRPRAE